MRELVLVIVAGITSGILAPFVAGFMVKNIVFLNGLFGSFLISAPFFGFWIIGFLSRHSNLILGTGVNSYKDENVKIKLKDLILKYFSTNITLGFGGSGGLVSPILFIGKGLAGIIDPRGIRMFSIAFASGMLTFYLGTPLTAALLAVEYFEKDKISYEDFMPALLASMISYYHHHFLGIQPIFLNSISAEHIPFLGMKELLLSFVFAPIFGLVGLSAYFLKWIYRKIISEMNIFERTIVSGGLVSLVALAIDPRVLGLRIFYSSSPKVAGRFLIGKILATVFTIESMGSSGYFTPLTVIGMNLGYVFSYFDFNAQIASVVGISSLLSSMLNIPVAAVVFPVELFGLNALVPAAIGSSVAYILYRKYRLE